MVHGERFSTGRRSNLFASEPLSTIHYLPSHPSFLQATRLGVPSTNARIDRNRTRGALLGTAVGDALGMPVEGLSHQNVRTYYKGIKEYRTDDQRGDLAAGQWTDDTQMTFALARALAQSASLDDVPARAAEAYVPLLPEARRWGPTTTAAVERLRDGASWKTSGDAERPTDGAAMRAAPLGLWWATTEASPKKALAALRPVLAVTHAHPAALTAGLGQAFAVRCAAQAAGPQAFDAEAFWDELVRFTDWAEGELATGPPPDRACSKRLRALGGMLHQGVMPLDLRDACDGAGARADEAWPLAVGMFARTPHLIEAALLATVNVGGDADTTGAMAGALLGALHGWDAFPAEWKDGLEARERLEHEADDLGRALARF
jgi:ADP-ribosylglycohydrolase